MLVRSVPIPTLVATWIPPAAQVLFLAHFGQDMDTTVAPTQLDFGIWIDGVQQITPPIPTVWQNPRLLDLGLHGGPLQPATASWSLPDYVPTFRWKVGKLVDPFEQTTVPVV